MRADNKAFANKVASLRTFIFSLQKSIKHLSLLLIFRQENVSSRTRQSSKTLPASLKDVGVRMNERNKHKMTGLMNHQTADPKAFASVFLFFS